MQDKQIKTGVWQWLLRNVVLTAGGKLSGYGAIERLKFLEQAQWWPRERLHDYRDQLLRSLVAVAYQEVPFYRELFDAAKVKPEDIRHPEDLQKLPIVTKDMLRQGYPSHTTRHTGFKQYEVHTSGSTGANMFLKEDIQTTGWYTASLLLVLEWSGWQIGEPHLQTGITPKRNLFKRLKDIFLRCYYISAFDLSDQQLDRSLELLERYNIRYLWGYPGSLYYLALRARQKGWNRALRSAVTWGDSLYPHYRRAIEEVFRTRVFDTYGCGEGVQIAAQCGYNDNYHVHVLDAVVEYVDGQGRPVLSQQESANLIITRLHPGPMPLIRYRIGDRATRGDNQSCPCGRGFDLMERIEGRETDVVITPSGNRLIVHFFTGVLEHFSEINSYQVIQEKPDSIIVRIVTAPNFSQQTVSDIIARLKEKGAADLKINIELVKEIPLPVSGKRRFVMSKIAQQTSKH